MDGKEGKKVRLWEVGFKEKCRKLCWGILYGRH